MLYPYIVRESSKQGSGRRRANMSESKVVQALAAFKSNYCWDKSLISDGPTAPSPALDKREAHSNTALEDFMNGVRV